MQESTPNTTAPRPENNRNIVPGSNSSRSASPIISPTSSSSTSNSNPADLAALADKLKGVRIRELAREPIQRGNVDLPTSNQSPVGTASGEGSTSRAAQEHQQLRQCLVEKDTKIAQLEANLTDHRIYFREITAFTYRATNAKAEKMRLELAAAVKEQGRLEKRLKEKEETLLAQLQAERNEAVVQRDAALVMIEQEKTRAVEMAKSHEIAITKGSEELREKAAEVAKWRDEAVRARNEYLNMQRLLQMEDSVKSHPSDNVTAKVQTRHVAVSRLLALRKPRSSKTKQHSGKERGSVRAQGDRTGRYVLKRVGVDEREDQDQEDVVWHGIGARNAKDNISPFIYTTIAEILAGEEAYASLASFGLANHALHDVVVPIFNRTVVLDQHTAGDSEVLGRCIVANEVNFKHTRFLFIRKPYTTSKDCFRFLLDHWPNLQCHVEWGNDPTPTATTVGKNKFNLIIHAPTRSSVLSSLLRSVIVRQVLGDDSTASMDVIGAISSVTFTSTGSLTTDRKNHGPFYHNLSSGSVTVEFESSDVSPEIISSLGQVLEYVKDRAAPLKGCSSVVARGDPPTELSLVNVSGEQLLPFVQKIRTMATGRQFRTISITIDVSSEPGLNHEIAKKMFDAVVVSIKSLWTSYARARKTAYKGDQSEAAVSMFVMRVTLSDGTSLIGEVVPTWTSEGCELIATLRGQTS